MMVETADGKHAVLIDPGHQQHGWVFYRGPDPGQWVTLREATPIEISMAEGVKRARALVSAKEIRPDYLATVCGGCDRPKQKCTCSDGDCG